MVGRMSSWLPHPIAILWGCSDTRPPSSNAPVAEDRDRDHIPDDEDRCPDTTAATASGCPLDDPSLIDTDGDGVPDARDECPDDPHPSLDPEADGCSPFDVPDGGRPPPLPDPRPPPPWQLLAGEAAVLQRQEDPICPHLASLGQEAVLGWQEGGRFYTSAVVAFPLGVGEARDEGSADGAAGACLLSRAVAVGGQGAVAVLLPDVVDDNWVRLKVKVRDADGGVGPLHEVATVPLPHRGEERRDTIASIAAVAGGRFVVVWADRDRLLARIIGGGAEGEGSPIPINRRALDVVQVGNPDVLSHSDGFQVIWQEGNAPFGSAAFASFGLDGEKIGDDQVLSAAEVPARWPVLAGGGEKTAAAWISPAGGSVQSISEAGARQLFRFAPQDEDEDGGDGAASFSPQLVFDDQDRAALVWVERYRRSTAGLRLYSHSAASELPADTAVAGTRVSPLPADGKAALVQQGDAVLLAHPVPWPARGMMLRSWRWTRSGQ